MGKMIIHEFAFPAYSGEETETVMKLPEGTIILGGRYENKNIILTTLTNPAANVEERFIRVIPTGNDVLIAKDSTPVYIMTYKKDGITAHVFEMTK